MRGVSLRLRLETFAMAFRFVATALLSFLLLSFLLLSFLLLSFLLLSFLLLSFLLLSFLLLSFLLLSFVLLLAGPWRAAQAQPAAEFYQGKQIRLIVGHPVGNDHDVGGRLLARYLGRHIPGAPTVVVQNMTA